MLRALVIASAVIGSVIAGVELQEPNAEAVMQCPPNQDEEQPGCIERPDQNPGGSWAQCCDGTFSHSRSRSGTCSRHGGVCS
jgi:Protein of unknown function (DUF3761)